MPSKQEKKEQRAQDRAEAKEILGSFHMNIDDAFTKIMNKAAGIPDSAPSGGRSNLIDKDQTYVAGKLVANEHMDWDSMLSRLGKVPQKQAGGLRRPGMHPGQLPPNTISLALQNRHMEQFQPVVNELARFKFASSPEKRETQMELIVTAVKKAIQGVAIQEVANNTKRFYDNAFRFAQTNNGIKVSYKVGNHSVIVTADGGFYGDEIVCLEQDGSNVTAYIARISGDDYEDITSNFSLKLELAK